MPPLAELTDLLCTDFKHHANFASIEAYATAAATAMTADRGRPMASATGTSDLPRADRRASNVDRMIVALRRVMPARAMMCQDGTSSVTTASSMCRVLPSTPEA